jgi:hypothetical protein
MKIKEISQDVITGIQNRQNKPLLTMASASAKLSKNEVKSFILYLAPANQNSFGINICPKASEGCNKACLFTAGRGKFNTVKSARIQKTDFMLFDPIKFYKKLTAEIMYESTLAFDKKIAFRLNGTSDINHYKQLKRYANFDQLKRYANFDINQLPNNVVFYEYTKNLGMAKSIKNEFSRVHITFSKSESNWAECLAALEHGFNVAAVFNKLPSHYAGYPVINGDLSDERFNDPSNVIVGLKAKGEARNDNSGFVINL